MRKPFLFVLAVTATIFVSCVSCERKPESEPAGQEEPENPDTPDTPEDNSPKPGTYTFTASPLKGSWEAGDQILVQGGWGPAAQVITLTSDQLSDDGKTASAELSENLFKYLTEPDPLYAVWPASAAKQEDGMTGQVINYDVSDVMLTQAYLLDGNFKFIDVSSFISFSVSGDYDRFMIAGKQRPGLRYSSYKNEYSSVKITPAKPKDDGYPFRRHQPTTTGRGRGLHPSERRDIACGRGGTCTTAKTSVA